MLRKCRDCCIEFETDNEEPWDDCEECFTKKVESENHPPCPSCESLRAANEELASKLATLQKWIADCPKCADLRAELAAMKARADFLETSVPGHIYDELMDLREWRDTMKAKLRELDAWMSENHYEQRTWWGMTDATRAKLRELGLVEARDE